MLTSRKTHLEFCCTASRPRRHAFMIWKCAPTRSRPSFGRTRPASASSDDQQVAELLKAANALMSKIGSHNKQPAAEEASEEANGGRQRIMKLVCDESSCVIVPVAPDPKLRGPSGSFIGSSGQSVAEANRPRDFLLTEGEGWKLGYDRDPINSAAFTALVGSDTWSVSMTKREFTDFIQLLRKLQRSIATLQTCGEWGGPPQKAAADGKSAESALELQTERIWMEARAPQHQLFTLTKLFQGGLQKRPKAQQSAFHLRFIINASPNERQREFEGRFPPEAVMRLLEHLETYPPTVDSLQDSASEGSRQSAVAGYIG